MCTCVCENTKNALLRDTPHIYSTGVSAGSECIGGQRVRKRKE